MSSLEKYLSEQGRIISTNVGVSMLPLLRQGKHITYIFYKMSCMLMLFLKVGEKILDAKAKIKTLERKIKEI